MKRITKFRIRAKKTGEIIGYETLFNGQWYASINGNIWFYGVYHGSDLSREQFIGTLDKNEQEIYEEDIVWDGQRKVIVSFDFLIDRSRKIRVLGDKYNNSELLRSYE